jgi:ATP-dependent RNA helicase DDX56/DBP9
MGVKAKALVIELNDDQRFVSKFERINHYYVLCKDDLDKFMMMFTLKKLGLLQGKLLIYATDVIKAYRIKYFFNRFHLKAFVLSPDLAK